MRKRLTLRADNDDHQPILIERKLLAAILRQSVLDIWKLGPHEHGYFATVEQRKAELVHDAIDWFDGRTGDVKPYFSFIAICEELDIDADKLRARVFEIALTKDPLILQQVRHAKKDQQHSVSKKDKQHQKARLLNLGRGTH